MDIKDLNRKLLEYEVKYLPNGWRSNGVDLWPIVKMVLAFEFEKRINSSSNSESRLSLSYLMMMLGKVLKKIRIIFNSCFSIFIIKSKEVDVFFASFPPYRESYKGKSVDKFFDPFMDYLEENGIKTMLFQYEFVFRKNAYKKDRVCNVYLSGGEGKGFKEFDLSECDSVISDFSLFIGIDEKELISSIDSTLFQVMKWKTRSDSLLEVAKPKKIFLVSYYSVQMFGLILAAKEKLIPTVEIQHGGLDQSHYCYNFSSTNYASSNTLPDYFWLWNKISTQTIQSWLPFDMKYRAFEGSNPWVEFLKNEDVEFLGKKRIGLFTLQTGLNPLVPQVLWNAIEDADDFLWIFRFHPRMSKVEIDAIRNEIKKRRLENKIDIDKFSSVPLPLLLKGAYIHISAFSGSLIEATIMNVPINITFHPIGKEAFGELIESKKMVYVNPTIDSEQFYNLLIECKEIKQTEEKDFKSLNEYYTFIQNKTYLNN